MTAVVIGKITCPDCGYDEVPFKESSKRQWATYTCPECGSQHFARSDKSNQAMRQRAILFDGTENQPENLEEEIIEEEIDEEEIIEADDTKTDDDEYEPGGYF